jgi:hypothetical protein
MLRSLTLSRKGGEIGLEWSTRDPSIAPYLFDMGLGDLQRVIHPPFHLDASYAGARLQRRSLLPSCRPPIESRVLSLTGICHE